MQNEETPTEVNPFLDIAERMSKPPAAPDMPTDNPFMDLAPSVRTVSQPPAIGSLSAVMGINPDQAAEASKLGTPLGIGQDLALRNMDELRRRSTIASVQRSGMLQNNPRLAQSLLDPVFAAQAHDDLDSLNATSNLFYKVASGIFETRAALLGGWERGFGTVERGELQSRKIFGSATPLDVARLEYLEKRLGDMPPGGVVSMTAEVVAQQLATARSVGTTALIGAAAGAAFGGGVPGSVAGFLSFGAAGLMATTTQTEAGNLYGDMVNDGVDPDTARYAALTGGLLNGIIELAGAKIAAAPFKALASKLMKDAVSSAIAKPTTRAAMAIAGKEYAKQVGTETAEEIGQELVAITSEELAKAFDGVDSEMSLKKAMTRLVDAGIAGFQGSLVLGGIGPTANFVVDVKRADVSARQQEFFDGLDAAKKDGKLPKRNLDAYEGFLARQAKGTTADTVYVEAEAAAQVLAQSGLSVTELEKVLPGIREQLQNALENGGDITIPTSVYGAKLSGTQIGDALRPHMRLSPEAMSVAQAQEFSRKRDALRQEAQTALAERQEADAAFVESAQKVETTVADQLRQTGMQDIEVRANAELFRDLAVTQAARMGITPEQFYDRYPYRVRGAQAVQEGQPLEQAAPITLADVEQSFADLGVEQRLTETATAIRPGIIRVPQELRNEGRATRAMQSLIAYADQSGKRIDVSPTSEFGASKKRLIAWYKRLGFVENKGSNKDFAISATMYRLPSAPVLEQASSIDADYLAAVERGDMATAQRMVDEAARASGLTEEVWRGDSRFDITEYAARRRNEPGIFTTYDERVAKDYAADGDVRRFYVGGKTLDLASRSREAVAWIQEWAKESGYDFIDRATGFEADPVEEYFAGDMWDFEGNGTGARWKDIQRTAKAQGYDIVRLRDSHYSQPMTSVVVLNENKIKLADPVTYDEAGNVVPLSRRFDITSPKVFEQAAMATRVPSAKGYEMAALDAMLFADWDAMKDNDKLIAGNLAKIKALNIPIKLDETKPPREQLEQFMEAVADNLDWLYQQMDPDLIQRAKLWYVGARRIAEWLSSRYGITDMQAAAMLAVLSPQKNWFENVSMADRIGDILTASRNEGWSPEMEKNFRRMVEAARAQVIITERQIAQNVEPTKPTEPRVAESDEEFKARKQAFDASRAELKAAYERDLQIWQEQLNEYEAALEEAQEAGESTTLLRADIAAHRRERPKSPRMPGRQTAETETEFQDRVQQYEQDVVDWQKRKVRLAKMLETKKKKIAYLDALSASDRMNAMRNGTLGDVLETKDWELAAMFVRMFDEEHNSREFAVITPEGGMAGPSMGAGGPMSMRWGSYSTIQKAISVYEDGRAENVHHQIGMAHKVRNFYNNIYDPTNVNAATIDTHAIAAAFLMPLSASDDIVGWGLGAGVSDAKLGLRGGYPILFEAYKRAADRRGIIAREEQSITWEAIRGLFVAAEKSTLKPIVAKVWSRYMDGEISLNDARTEVFQLSGGIKTPEWVAQPSNLPVGSTYAGRSRTLMDTMAPTIQAQMQEPTRLMLEIAPDPRNTQLTAAWKSLTPERRFAISRDIVGRIVPRVLAEFGLSGVLAEQIGGWEGDTNMSFALAIPTTTLVRQVSNALRDVLSQEAIFSISAEQFVGSERAGLVVVDLQPGITPAQLEDLYATIIWPTLKVGHSTVGSTMIIGLEAGVDRVEIATKLQTALNDDPRVLAIEHKEAWTFEDKQRKASDSGARDDRPEAARADTRRRLDALKSEATELVARAIAGDGRLQQAARGDFDPAKLMTTLREGRDFSTFAHETAHFYLTILADIARSATGPQQTKADMDALLSWFGIEGATPAERLAKWSSLTIDQQRQYHEQFAYSFEIYLHEGKAPSVEMQSLFNQFAAWLKRVYKSIRDELNATYKAQFGRDLPLMNSEIRLVMDRMLATDEQIARAQAVRGMKAMFQTQEQSGMNDAEWAAYQALEQDATDAATAELTKATLKELQWYGNAQSKYLREIQSKHDRARKEIREEVSAQVQLEPVYRAMEFLKKGTIRTDTGEVTAATGAFKLDLAKVRAIMPAGFDPASLKYGKYGMVQDGGMDPDMAAGMFGYGSGVELINAILGAKPIKAEIDARTDQRMLDENSDLATPEARQAAVDMAIHNEARARFIAVEQRWLEKQRRPANDMLQAARQVAQDIIGEVVIRTLNPRRYEAAEAEAARTATTAYREPQDPSTAGQAAATRAYNEAIAAGRTPDEATVAATEAGVAAVAKAQERRAEFDAKYGGREPAEVARRAKRQQLVQNQLAREAMLAKEEIAAAGRDFRKFFRSDEQLAKTRDMAPIMAARAILSYYGYGKRGESPAQYLEQLRTYAPELYDGIAPIVLKSLSGTADYRDLTVTEFRVLRDTVQALWAQARRDRQITVEGERVALDVVLKEMADRLRAIGVGERVGQRQAPGAVDQANRHLLGLRAMMSRVEAWADALDGMAGPGAFTKYLFRPVKQAVDAYRIERNKYVERFVKLLDGIDLPVGKIAAPELDYTFGNGNGGIGRAELLGALMHTGNEGNYRKLLLGRGWGELDADGNLDDSRWRSFVARMIAEDKLTKADYDFVQSIWDLLEEIKPLAQRAHFDMYGYYFKEVEATEVVTPFGTYRGGYVPAATDKFMVQDARVNASMDELEGDWRNSLPSTGAGFTKGRVDYNEALSLDLRLIATHTDAVLRFSMIQPSVKDALKILRDRDLKALLERFDPAVMENMLLPWLNRAARQQATEPGRWKVADKFWGGVRSRAGVATMFANLRNALQQVTGWFPSLLKVKRRYLQSALMTYLGSPKQTAEAVAALSPFMADRMRNQMFELQGTMNELLLNPSKYEKLQQWSSKHGYFLQQAFQNMVDVTTWQGAYNQALAEGETQAEAVARGDAAVRLTQGSLSPEDLSMFEVGTPFYRTFVQFTGYFNMLANLNLGEFQKTVRDMGWRSGKGRLLYIYVMGMLLPAIVSDAIVRSLGGGWDDEDEDGYMDVFMDWFFGSQVRMGAALLPFGSTAYTAITTAFNDKPYDDRITTSPSIAALESATIGASKAIIAVTDEDKDVTGRNVRDVLTLITLLTGVPVSALGRPAGYLIDVERGEIEPESGYDMIRGMITGTATPESKR